MSFHWQNEMLINVDRLWRGCRAAVAAAAVLVAELVRTRGRQSVLPACPAPVLLCRRRPVNHHTAGLAATRRPRPPPAWVHRDGQAVAVVLVGRCSEQPCYCAAFWWPPRPRCWLFPVPRPTWNLMPPSSSTSRPPSNSVSDACPQFLYVTHTFRAGLMYSNN